MTIREQVRAKLEKVDDEHLAIVHRMLQSLETMVPAEEPSESWSDFIAATYGCLADAPIERGEQGDFEIRDLLR
ncbi:MAG: hypothetical protein HC897_02035 [Thermoanaerobaculia bacterium]|nr:hypothetical protein [Thermoanaerobaculia bacterium]